MVEKYENVEKVLYIEDYYDDVYMYKKKLELENQQNEEQFQSIVIHILDDKESKE